MREEVVISGGNGFLGSYLAKALSKTYKVYSLDINQKNSIRKKNIVNIKCDITKPNELVEKLDFIKKRKAIVHLINNAAIDSVPKDVNSYNYATSVLIKNLTVSLQGSQNLIEFFAKKMCANKYGSIINVGSDLSIVAPNQEIYTGVYKNFKKSLDYSVIKHGMVGLNKYFAALYAKDNVRVNMVSPAPIKNKQRKKLIQNLKKVIPMKKLAEREDVFELISFLLSKKSKFITGQNILIDGGRSII